MEVKHTIAKSHTHCDKCGKCSKSVFGGHSIKAGEVWCLECCDKHNIQIPPMLRSEFIGENNNAIYEQYLETQKKKKRMNLEKFLASRNLDKHPINPLNFKLRRGKKH